MSNILTAEELRETFEYVETLSNAPDNTSGAELDQFTAELIREVNG